MKYLWRILLLVPFLILANISLLILFVTGDDLANGKKMESILDKIGRKCDF